MEKADVIIQRCMILAMKDTRLINDGVLIIKDGKIVFSGPRHSAPHIRAEIEIDGSSHIAMPGLVNCHTHLPMTLFRGVAEDRPLESWLKDCIWPLESKLKPDDVYQGALLGCLEMVKGGTTCFADMYFHEDMISKAVKESGLRGVLAEGIIGLENNVTCEKLFARGISFARGYHGYADGRVNAMLGPHSAYSCNPELLTKVRETASELDIGVHLHLAESADMFRQVEQLHGLGEAGFLDSLGFFQGLVLAAHCVNLSEGDMQILSKRKVNVAHVPVANMKLGLGAAKVKEMIELEMNVGLGTDGAASNNSLDMFETMKTAGLLQKLAYRDPTVLPAYEILRMATLNGAKALGLETEIGSLEVGKKADVILIDLSRPHLRPLHDVYATIVYSARASDVDTVIVDGKVLVEKGKVQTLDEQAVMKEAENVAFDLLSR